MRILEGEPVNGGSGPGGPAAIGTVTSPIDVGEIVLNAPIRAMAFNSNLPNCSYCYTGAGVKGGLQNMGILPRPLSHEEALRRVSVPVLHNGSAQMLDSVWDIIGIAAANAKPENKELALGLAAIAVITTRGRALPAIMKAEVATEKGLLYEPIRLTTSSKSLVPSRTYTIYNEYDEVLKFGVSDANLLRYNKSLKDAGPGAYGKFSEIMPKNQAHISERYSRSLHYNSTGQWDLPRMKVPHPVDFNTLNKIKKP